MLTNTPSNDPGARSAHATSTRSMGMSSDDRACIFRVASPWYCRLCKMDHRDTRTRDDMKVTRHEKPLQSLHGIPANITSGGEARVTHIHKCGCFYQPLADEDPRVKEVSISVSVAVNCVSCEVAMICARRARLQESQASEGSGESTAGAVAPQSPSPGGAAQPSTPTNECSLRRRGALKKKVHPARSATERFLID